MREGLFDQLKFLRIQGLCWRIGIWVFGVRSIQQTSSLQYSMFGYDFRQFLWARVDWFKNKLPFSPRYHQSRLKAFANHVLVYTPWDSQLTFPVILSQGNSLFHLCNWWWHVTGRFQLMKRHVKTIVYKLARINIILVILVKLLSWACIF